jgi:uncharacterized Ntn-hydrolase superfamily protein
VRSCLHLAFALLGPFVAAAPAGATWSIVAVDPETREVGAAGASCILDSQVIAEVVPGRGAAVAQAFTNPDAGPRLRADLAAGKTAAAAVSAVTSRWFDSFVGAPTANLRQYGVATLVSADEPANFTGRWTVSWSGARAAPGVSVQGNSLRGPEVVDRALAAFRAEGRGCQPTLADRLIAGLAAGSAAGGDRRCVAGLSALSAFVFVAGPGDPADRPRLQLVRNRPGEPPWTPWSEIRNAMRPHPGTAAENPVRLLEAAYDAWRADSGSGPRCPTAEPEPGRSLPTISRDLRSPEPRTQ